MDGKIVVEDEAGELSDFTTVSWQVGLGETLCYRFRSENSGRSGTVEVTFLSLKSVYSILDSYRQTGPLKSLLKGNFLSSLFMA